MQPDAIAALPVADLADTDCRLFLWATNRYLPAAVGIVTAWGFRYRQTLVWRKLDAHLWGSVAASSAEFLLVGVKGKPATGEMLPSAVVDHAQAKQHSCKPVVFMDAIERVSPGPYVELFARSPRLGWDHWGYGYESDIA